MGRTLTTLPPKEPTCSVEIRRRLLNLVRSGVPWKFAASAVLLKRSTVEKWFAEGQEQEERYEKLGTLPRTMTDHQRQCRLLYIDAMVASDVVVARLCQKIQKAAGKDWHAARWLLEVREPKSFRTGRGEGLGDDKPNGEDDGPVVNFVSPDNGRGGSP